MTTDIKELVKRLRDGDVCKAWRHDAADALEAMAGEVERYRESHKGFMTLQAALERVSGERVSAIAERDRLKAALVEVEDRLNCRGNPDIAHYCPNCDNSLHNAREIARKALGGDAS